MASKKKKPAIEGTDYNSLKAYYRVANNDLSGSTPTRGPSKDTVIGDIATRSGRGRIAQRAIDQRKNQQRKNQKRGAM